MDLDKDICGLALDDEDLKPLWDWIARRSQAILRGKAEIESE
jgi:hypothetical protein